ncbi:MAG: DUF4242 domain-containing protein [Flavobacteriaceae bacterium]
MKTIKVIKCIAIGLFFSLQYGFSQEQASVYAKINEDLTSKEKIMNTYLIEREIPEAGKLTPEQLKGISQKSNEVLFEMGPGIEWLHSYVTDNKVYCVYKAENETLLREHAEKGGFPINKVSILSTQINPETAKD